MVRVHGRGECHVSPWSLFSLVAGDDALVALDRLCRIVHVLNFRAAALVKCRLFLNVHGRLLAAVREDHGHAFRDAIEGLKLDTRRIVIETPDTANLEPKLLALVLSNYRLNGFAVAANVRDLSELEALLRMVRPDFVKLDARQFRDVGLTERALDRIRESGVRPVFTRVERADQRDFLLGLDGVLVQGRAIADAARLPQHTPEPWPRPHEADGRQADPACAC